MCLYPINAYLVKYTNCSGEVVQRIDFKKKQWSKYVDVSDIQLPCNKCFECCKNYSEEWQKRIVLEAKIHLENCFVTLTYKENPISLNKRDYQLFLKRLRKKIFPIKIRYFLCGEYGSKGKRPHYHCIIFGWCPSDLEYFFTSGKNKIYKSKFLSDIWQLGFVSVGEVSEDSAKYCAKYMQKLQKIDKNLMQPFVAMSLKPGIGLNGFDVKSFETDKIYLNGKFSKIPRYFVNKHKNIEFGQKIQNMLILRLKKAKLKRLSEKDLEFKRKNIESRLKNGIY